MAATPCIIIPLFFFFFHLPILLHGLHFNFANFKGEPDLNRTGDARYTGKELTLTQNSVTEDFKNSVGRAVYPEKIHLWDSVTNTAADFETHFTFNISKLDSPVGGDGIAFFIAANDSNSIGGAGGGCLGLITNCSFQNASGIVAVEFDTFKNGFDSSETHVGININSIKSVITKPWDIRMKNGSVGNAWVSYDSKATNLSVFLTYPPLIGSLSLSYQVNLSEVLPEWVAVGFSSSTGLEFEIHYLLSWEFNSTELPSVSAKISTTDGAQVGAVAAGAASGSFIIIGSVIAILIYLRRKKNQKKGDIQNTEQNDSDHLMDYEFEHESGPRRFSYADLVQATNNFAEEGKLGEGGFGGVYKGFLPVLNQSVAVKRVSKTSKQGRKEYMAEVKIISKLRHKNLVQLIGWCHEKGEFLLIYEFMPNGSLDSHIFKGANVLSWAQRYKIAIGLASALVYLHEESEQSVVHRDIKSSNVMLDSNFNTKLGDFGLARLMDQELGLKTTGLAGTFGYMAPEYMTMGKASKGSDVYSFGVVALEIACGRRSMEARNQEVQISLVGWAWHCYENDRLLEVADKKLCVEFDTKQMECLLMVGLWCAYPDYSLRPSIRQALQVLNFEAPLPNLPKKMPVPKYDVPTSSSASSTEPFPFSLSKVAMGR